MKLNRCHTLEKVNLLNVFLPIQKLFIDKISGKFVDLNVFQ
jgi:hypothetical protein